MTTKNNYRCYFEQFFAVILSQRRRICF